MTEWNKLAKELIEKNLAELSKNLTKIRGNSINLEAIEELSIVYQGKKEKIKNLATFRFNSSQGKLIVQVFEVKKIQLIKEVILGTRDFQQTNEDRMAAQEKNELYFSLTPMTGEYRQRLVKEANKIIEEAKIKLQNSRREILKKASFDEKKQAEKEFDRVKDKYLLEIQKLQKEKEKELGVW